MPDEDGFLAVIRQTPADNVARLVYADWLDEQDDSTFKLKAEFIRLELRLANEPFSFGLTAHLRLLAELLDRDWLVIISRPKIEGCTTRAGLPCPAVWSALNPTSELEVRTCGACQQPVCYAHTAFPASHYIQRGHRTVISLAVRRTPDALRLPHQFALSDLTREPLIERPRIANLRDEFLAHNERVRAEAARDVVPLEDAPPSTHGRPTPKKRRQKGRRRNRSIERESWEEAD